MFDTLVRGGTVVNAFGQTRADVAIEDGCVVGVGTHYSDDDAREVIDAGGLLVLPGLVDPHVHFDMPFMGTVTRHSFFTGSVAAAAGGVTTFIDFAFQEKGRPAMEAIEARMEEAKGQPTVDYGFHAIFTDVRPGVGQELRQLVSAGIASWKVFMAYRSLGIMVDDGGLLTLLNASRDLPCVGIVHAENAALIEYMVAQFLDDDKRSARYHALSRPPLAEAEAVARAARLAGQTDAPLYFFHVSSAAAVAEIQKAQGQGWPVYAETCPHYLMLDETIYDQDDGYNWCMSPPLRTEADRDALWQALASGALGSISSDDGAFDAESKAQGRDSFDLVPNGVPGVETRLSLLFSEGVHKERITVERLVALCSTNPARLFGLYPRKGLIAPGSDADLVLVDPQVERTLGLEGSYMKAGWHPFEGWRVRGAPVLTMLRGRVIMKEDEFCGEAGLGHFVERRFDGRLRRRAVL
ncbi:MAG: dihydropyrimidinase [Chloroflexota bacterium]